jgi:hypothetical protein
VALGFWEFLEHSPSSESLRGLGGAKFLDLEDQDKGVAVVIPTKKPKRCLKRGVFAVFFLGVVEPCFCWGFWQKTGGRTWFFDGEFVVDRW